MISKETKERMDGLIRVEDKVYFKLCIRSIIRTFREEEFEDAEISSYIEKELETAFEEELN